MKLLSVIIPSRSELYLQRTIDDALQNAAEDVEVVAVLDGYEPKVPIKKDPRVKVLHHGSLHSSPGMRASINFGAKESSGDYIMKLDEHCALGKGYDKILKAGSEDNWLVVPRMYGLDAETWKRTEITDLKNNQVSFVDNMFFRYPYLDYRPWNAWTEGHQDILIDDCLGFAGSCYFMPRKHWDWLGGLDEEHYDKFHYEPQELCLKTWLGGGRVVCNKKTWYAHWHRRGKGYKFSKEQYNELYNTKTKVSRFVHDYWLNDKWENRVHDFEWLINKFWVVQSWPPDWKEQLTKAGVIHSKVAA